MKILIVFLGTGASGGTPGLGKSNRLESSAFIKEGLNILIDTTRDFVKQIKFVDKNLTIVNNLSTSINAVLLTHGHLDACGGIAKLSPNIPVFAHPKTLRIIQQKFCLSKLKLIPVRSGQIVKLGNWDIIPQQIPHSKDPRFPTFAWKLAGPKTIIYASDIAELTLKFKDFCNKADLLIIDGATWKRKIFTHLRVDQDLPIICRWPVGKIILTQIGQSAPPHEEFKKIVTNICPKAIPAYDGMEISI